MLETDDLIVEVPLNSEYLTSEGIYTAGYIWGSNLRSPDDPAIQDYDPEFIQGVSDGYGDKMREIELKKAMDNQARADGTRKMYNKDHARKLINEDRKGWYENPVSPPKRRKLEKAEVCSDCNGLFIPHSPHTCLPKKKWYQRKWEPNPFWS